MSAVIPYFITGLLVCYPVYVIFKRAGLNPAYTLLVFIPAFGLLMAGVVLSNKDWQVNSRGGNQLDA